mgnify:CR=1 FL=1
MGKSIRMIAEEIGVSKQAVYKRFTGKLKNVCAPYVYTEYNCIYLTEEGEAIIKKDFADNPCAVPVHTQYIRNTSVPVSEQTHSAYGAGTEQAHDNSSSELNTPRSINSEQPIVKPASSNISINNAVAETNPHTYMYTDADRSAAYESANEYTEQSPTQTISVSDTEYIRSDSIENAALNAVAIDMIPQAESVSATTETEQGSTPSNSTPHTAYTYMDNAQSTYGSTVHDTEQIRSDANQSVSYTDEILKKTEKYEAENSELKEKLHEMELKLIKANAEIEKSDEKIKYLDQKLNDKEQMIADQRQNIDKIDTERKILTASLLKNNSFIENLIKLPLSKRIFGWKDVKKQLTDSRNDVISDVTAGDSAQESTIIAAVIHDDDEKA